MTNGGADGPDELVLAARALEAAPTFPVAYAARVRSAVRRLDPFPPGPLDVPQALALVSQEARIDVDAPLRSKRRGAKMVKLAVKRLTAWYLLYVGQQVGDLGQSMVHLGEALSGRLESVQTEVEELRRRVERLETEGGEEPPHP